MRRLKLLETVRELFYIQTIIWLFPVIFMFHGLEEIITVESFITKYKNKIRETFLVRLTLTIKRKLGAKSVQLSISMAWILLFISFIAFMTVYLLPIGANFLLLTAALNVFLYNHFPILVKRSFFVVIHLVS